MDPKAHIRCMYYGLKKISDKYNIKIDDLYKEFGITLIDYDYDNIHRNLYSKTKCCAFVEKDGQMNQCMRKIKSETNDNFCQIHYNIFKKKCLMNMYLPLNLLKKDKQVYDEETLLIEKKSDGDSIKHEDEIPSSTIENDINNIDINKSNKIINHAWQHDYEDYEICTTWIIVNGKDYLLDQTTHLIYDFHKHTLIGKTDSNGRLHFM